MFHKTMEHKFLFLEFSVINFIYATTNFREITAYCILQEQTF